MARKIIAFNGGPRKTWNTGTLLEHALSGAAETGAETETVHLYDLDYKGCTSCFACKLKGGVSYGKCAMRDQLTPWLNKAEAADALLLGSPVYLGDATGAMRSLLERLVFPYLTYTPVPMSLRNPRVPVGLVFTMGAPEEAFTGEMAIFKSSLEAARLMLGFVYGRVEMLCSYDTLQFDDYSKYEASRFDPEAKAKRHAEVFPEDCTRARELGRRLMGEA